MSLITLKNMSPDDILHLIDRAIKIKETMKGDPPKYLDEYGSILKNKTMLMLFEKPSLRTRLSFEAGMNQFGGSAIFYGTEGSYIGTKESMYDTAKSASRFVDIIMARLYKHESMEELAEFADVPVINGMTDFNHPCQALGDLQTVREIHGKFDGLKMAYVGDAFNNVTHSLLYICSKLGVHISIGCPEGDDYSPLAQVLEESRGFASESGSDVNVYHNAEDAVAEADIVYTDTWMSYHIPQEQKDERLKVLGRFCVTTELMSKAKPSVKFMHCLPAWRGREQTAEVIDGPQSIVFDQAENRLHAQKAIILDLLGIQ